MIGAAGAVGGRRPPEFGGGNDGGSRPIRPQAIPERGDDRIAMMAVGRFNLNIYLRRSEPGRQPDPIMKQFDDVRSLRSQHAGHIAQETAS